MQAFSKKFILQQKNNKLFWKSFQRFGGGHHDHGAVEHVELEQGSLIGNKDISKELVSIYGFQDKHYHPHHDETDPFQHLRNTGTFSLRRLYFADPWYVPDEDEHLMNEPHGYLTNDDPMDTRNNYEKSSMEILLLFSCALPLVLLFGYQGLQFRGAPVELFDQDLTAELLENEIRNIRIRNQELLNRRDELKAQLSE